MKKVVVSQIAKRKLILLKDTLTEEFGTAVSSKAISSLIHTMDNLGIYSEQGVRICELYNIDTDYYYIFSHHNYIIYRFDDSTVTILELFNERQDFMKTLFGISGRTRESIDYWGE